MSLIFDNGLLALGGNTVVHARKLTVRIVRANVEIARFQTDAPAEWLKVSPDGHEVLIYGAQATRAWLWREGAGLSLLASVTGTRDAFGCGFIRTNGALLTLVAQHGVLRGMSRDGRQQFEANLRSPKSFHPRSFIHLPLGLLALLGNFYGDPLDTVITLRLSDLLQNPEAVQRAISNRSPIWDRAVKVTVGPCETSFAVVFRDPEDYEVAEDEKDLEDLGDIGNFKGLYVRDLGTGTVIERHNYEGAVSTVMPIVATQEWIAIQVLDGIEVMARKTSSILRVDRATLDPFGIEVARIRDDDQIETMPLTKVISNPEIWQSRL